MQEVEGRDAEQHVQEPAERREGRPVGAGAKPEHVDLGQEVEERKAQGILSLCLKQRKRAKMLTSVVLGSQPSSGLS